MSEARAGDKRPAPADEPSALPKQPRSEPEQPRSEPGQPRSEPGQPRSEPGEPRSEPGQPRSDGRLVTVSLQTYNEDTDLFTFNLYWEKPPSPRVKVSADSYTVDELRRMCQEAEERTATRKLGLRISATFATRIWSRRLLSQLWRDVKDGRPLGERGGTVWRMASRVYQPGDLTVKGADTLLSMCVAAATEIGNYLVENCYVEDNGLYLKWNTTTHRLCVDIREPQCGCNGTVN